MQQKYLKHHIQGMLFKKLRERGPLRYKDLKLDSIESSLFVYHLKELIKSSIIEKDKDGKYRLTQRGVTLSQHYSSETDDIRLAVPSYTIIMVRSVNGRWLLYKREKAPFVGRYSTISGKMHHGESLTNSLERELREVLTVIDDVKPHFVCYSSIIIHGAESDATTHITGPIWFLDNIKESFINSHYKKGTLLWHDWKSLDYSEFIPGWREIIDRVATNDHAILDIEIAI